MSAASSPDLRDGHRIELPAAATAPVRDRYVDFVRVAAVVMVIFGHWFVIAITRADGRLAGQNILGLLSWTHWTTWLVQVVPLLFFVGGYANASSWSAFTKAGGTSSGWLYVRATRLLRPTTVYLVVMLLAATIARAVGVDPVVLDQAAWLVGIHLWFLAIYVAVVIAAPIMLAAHRRWGARVVVGAAGLAAAVDILRLAFDLPYVGALNYALVWGAIHQAGFLWRDGLLPRGAVLALGGLLAVILLTGPGPYPVSMVNVPGAELQATEPPGLSILALAALQAGVILALRHPVERWLDRQGPRAVVARLNDVVMTMYLWHLVPVVLGAAILYGTGILPDAEIGSGPWLGLRVAWIAALTILLAALVAIFGRLERRREAVYSARAHGAMVIAAMAAAVGGLALITLQGVTEPGALGIPVLGVGAFAAAIVLLAACRQLGSTMVSPRAAPDGTVPVPPVRPANPR